MTRNGFARLAGFMFLFYIANGIADMVISGRIERGESDAAILVNIARHVDVMHFTTFLTLLTGIDAILLGVALYAITRDFGHDLAIMALMFRVAEGVNGAMAGANKMHTIEFATRSRGGSGELATYVLHSGGGITIGGTLFACGSAIFAYLILRGRVLPAWLARFGIAASVVLLIALPMQMCGIRVTPLIWAPMAVFEVVGGVWLLVRGAGNPEGSLQASAGFRP